MLSNKEQFTETQLKIIDGLGTLFSHLGADIGIMVIINSWGDTMNSEDTLQNG